jgi:aspartokinase
MAQQRIIAQKFGGTSVATGERRQRVIGHIRRALDEGFRPTVVVSAMGRRGDPYATDTLLDLLAAEGTPVSGRDYDFIFQAGEIISVALMTHLLKLNGIPAVGLTGSHAGIQTNGRYKRAEIVNIDTTRLLHHIAQGEVPVVTGGQGVSTDGDVNILGRGGSDTSGVAVGVALGAERVEVYSDVPGIAMADPRVVPGARFLDVISYAKIHEMGRYGAKVIHPRAVLVAQKGGTPIACRSTFEDGPGTLITDTEVEQPLVGICSVGPVDVLVLDEDLVSDAELEDLYERLGVVAIKDGTARKVVLAVEPGWRGELEETLSAKELPPVRALSDRSLVSLVGATGFIEESLPRVESILATQDVEVCFRERAELRSTFAVPSSESSRVVQTLYESLVAQAN